MYKHVLKPIFFKFNPETVHNFMVWFGELMGKSSFGRWCVGLMYGYRGKDISKTVDGITYRTPFLLSAGFDYNARLTNILSSISLGGEEVGSVTARVCAGNPKPHLTRLPKSKSILVNKGLMNDGVDVIIERIKRNRKVKNFVVGVSIARTNDEKSISIGAGIEDYCASFKKLNEAGVGDYYTINISCPNSFGGESFIELALLTRLLDALKKIPCTKPVYIKMPINISWEHFSSLLEIIDKSGYQGVVIGNLNKDYSKLDVRGEAPKEYRGGTSGRPCTHLSTELIYKTRDLYGKRFTIIGVGGVSSVETAQEKIDAGADLIQVITGLIYQGPGLVKKMCKNVQVK